MVVPKEENLMIYGTKLSSVGPGTVTGQDITHEPSNMDLAMKLHYLRGVYYFRSPAFQDISIMKIKEPMFTWLDHFYVACGRFRRSESSGRPYIKCNDCGVRFVESHCDKTLDEWLEMKDISLHEKLLVPNQVIGPEIAFSPTVFIQLTRFKCGGASLGLSWAHVLGDAFSAVDFMNKWGQVAAGHQLPPPFNSAKSDTKIEKSPSPPINYHNPLSIKRVGPVGDHWITTNECKMESFSFHVKATQLSQLQSEVCGRSSSDRIPPFESLCAIIWQCVATVRDGPEPKIVTISKNDSPHHNNRIFGNGQMISVVKANFSILEADPNELAELIINQAVDETSRIEEAVGRDEGLSDFVLYGANLTFVDLERANLYGLEFKGQKSIYANYTIDGVGGGGVVLVLPAPEDGGKGGRIVTIMMPENEVMKLKSELQKQWAIA